MTKERACPNCGASYDVRWGGCDRCGYRTPRPFLRPAVQKAMPAIRASIRSELAKHELGTTQRGQQRPFYGVAAAQASAAVTTAVRAAMAELAKDLPRDRRRR